MASCVLLDIRVLDKSSSTISDKNVRVFDIASERLFVSTLNPTRAARNDPEVSAWPFGPQSNTLGGERRSGERLAVSTPNPNFQRERIITHDAEVSARDSDDFQRERITRHDAEVSARDSAVSGDGLRHTTQTLPSAGTDYDTRR